MILRPQELGSFTFSGTANMPAPTSDTDGFATYGARYVNVWAQASTSSGTIRYQAYTYLYRTGIGWVRFSEGIGNLLNVYVSTNGLLAEIEVRGAERIYFRRIGTGTTSGADATILLEAFSYK